MRNVIVLAVLKTRYAVEIRWVREVFTLGHVTPVPNAPPTIAGVTNFRGSIMPVLDLPCVLYELGRAPAAPERLRPPALPGDGAIVVETDDVRAAFRVDNVAEVSTLREGQSPQTLIDSTGREIELLDPPQLLRAAISATLSVVESGKAKT